MNAIYEGRYKDLLAVIVENDIIKATFLPYNGAKMASLYDKVKGRELLCPANGETYRPIGLYSSYIDGELTKRLTRPCEKVDKQLLDTCRTLATNLQ